MPTITYEEFECVNLRSGTVVRVEEFPRAKKPAFKVWADFVAQKSVYCKPQLRSLSTTRLKLCLADK